MFSSQHPIGPELLIKIYKRLTSNPIFKSSICVWVFKFANAPILGLVYIWFRVCDCFSICYSVLKIRIQRNKHFFTTCFMSVLSWKNGIVQRRKVVYSRQELKKKKEMLYPRQRIQGLIGGGALVGLSLTFQMLKSLTFLTLPVTFAGLDSLNFSVTKFLWYGKCRQKTSLMGSNRVKKYSQLTFRLQIDWQTLPCVSHSNRTCARGAGVVSPGTLPQHQLTAKSRAELLGSTLLLLNCFPAVSGYPG